MTLPDHLGGQVDGNVDIGVVSTIVDALPVRSLIDIGCGDGAATLAYAGLGLDVRGIDGDWTRLPDDERFVLHDFTAGPFAVKPADLAYSVEFLEHIEERFLPNVMPLFAACRFAVVTAALPGQVGHHHVNCRGQAYWRNAFDAYGMTYDDRFTATLRAASTMCKAKGPNTGKPIRFFRRTGMFFRRR